MNPLHRIQCPCYDQRTHTRQSRIGEPAVAFMKNLPTLDLLEKAHAFPCPYLFKIIGKADEGFPAQVVAVVREELLIEVDPRIAFVRQ